MMAIACGKWPRRNCSRWPPNRGYVWKASSYFPTDVGFYPSYNLGNVINMRAFSKIEAVLLLTFNYFLSGWSGGCPTAHVHFSTHNLTEADLHVVGDITSACGTCNLESLYTVAVWTGRDLQFWRMWMHVGHWSKEKFVKRKIKYSR